MPNLAAIERLVEPVLEDMGYNLVRLQMQGTKRMVLQIMAEPKADRPMGVEDCAAISRALSAILDVEEPIDEAYSLEVSSPGIDRPLTRPEHFERYVGFDAKVEMDHLIDGRKRFTGKLLGVEGEEVLIEIEDNPVRLPLDGVQKAKLVLTDALLKAAAREQEA
ncbi:MAG: ribosome maturation factor RimP [Rhodospirillales bacterium]|nr:ribosome maturation factor RimP [Rhodospirillales bacterium]MCW8863155.1 ribosome maturation factor RimP [Rhodospirillales bacterium]MCW8953299.1 ribosome maturation factor RimP [Rhodospirillales bacterium]MCW8970325.1 ribosome maturation factor RimP [Rhodospirillales bacterium]MCW9002484.1 ribosome maturation factor RimP [Rhodospirillales bacterium]